MAFGLFKKAAQPAAEQKEIRPAFIVDTASLNGGQVAFLNAVAGDLQRQMPVLALHGVFGDNANKLSLAANIEQKPPFILTMRMGPVCGSNCPSGKKGQEGTVAYIESYLAKRPEISAGAVGYKIIDLKQNVLASGPK